MKDGQLKINDVGSATSISLFIDSIKLIKKNGHQTYTIPIKQANANDITFRNLIIDTYNINSGKLHVGDGETDNFTYDVSQYYGSLAQQNVATIFLGSFGNTATVTAINGNTATIQFTETNISGWESATRLIKAADNSHVGIIPDKPRGAGLNLGGNWGQVYTWTETINL